MPWRFNKGEWSEAYVFLKLLADGRIYAGDEKLKKNEEVYMDILKCIKQDADIRTEYVRERGVDFIVIQKDGSESLKVEIDKFKNASEQLLNDIKNGRGRTFESESTERFMHDELGIEQFKSAGTENDEDKKTDIQLQISDFIDSSKNEIGFSIKSHLGSAPTLFNCSEASKLVYRIDGCNEELMYTLNAMKNKRGGCDLGKRLKYIKNSRDLKLVFLGSKIKYGKNKETGPVFKWNLEHLDANLLEVINCMLLSCYGYYDVKPKTCSLPDVVNAVARLNPLDVHSPKTVYVSKFKDFLYCCFAGLTASNKWDGTRHVNGGYIDVKKNGDVLFYRALSDDQFTSFLFNNIKLEKPSHGSYCKYTIAEADRYFEKKQIPENILKDRYKDKKGDYGYVYYDENSYDNPCYCIDINFTFRFKK